MENQLTQQPQPQAKACPRDCSKCNYFQQTFCAAKLSYDAFGHLNAMYSRLEAIEKALEKFGEGKDFVSPSSPTLPSSPFSPATTDD